jgi:hypothetical protein
VTGSLSDRRGAALRRRHEAAEGGTLVHYHVLDVKRVDVDRLVVLAGLELGVGDGGAQNLFDLLRGVLLGETKKPQRFVHVLAADLVHDEAHLVR